MIIIKSNPNDYKILTEITKKSKAYWGYSSEQMDKWADLLTITKSYIEANDVFKLLIDCKIVGYYSNYNLEENIVKLDNLFVLPEFIGYGFGKLLINDFFNRLKNMVINKIVLNAEPNTEKFYEKFGFVKIGQIETTIKGRYLPLMEINI